MYFGAFLSQPAVFLTPFIVIIVAVITLKAAVSSDWYKKFFAENETKFAECTKQIFAPLKRKIFGDLGERLKEVRGDVLEIGIGAGENSGVLNDRFFEKGLFLSQTSNRHLSNDICLIINFRGKK